MNGELWAPGKPSFTKPYCSKWGFAEMDRIIHSYLRDRDKETAINKTQKTQINNSYSRRPGMETSGVVGNQVL